MDSSCAENLETQHEELSRSTWRYPRWLRPLMYHTNSAGRIKSNLLWDIMFVIYETFCKAFLSVVMHTYVLLITATILVLMHEGTLLDKFTMAPFLSVSTISRDWRRRFIHGHWIPWYVRHSVPSDATTRHLRNRHLDIDTWTRGRTRDYWSRMCRSSRYSGSGICNQSSAKAHIHSRRARIGNDQIGFHSCAWVVQL